jgi:cytochrome c556
MRMDRKSWFAFGVVAILVTGVGVVHSSRSAADSPVIQERRALMKDMGKQMGIINDFLEKGAGDAAAVKAAADQIHSNAAKIPDLFPQGTSLADNVGETGAKPEIWANFDNFKQAAARLGTLSSAASAAADTGEKTAIADAFKNMGENGCGGCHKNFRQKLN